MLLSFVRVSCASVCLGFVVSSCSSPTNGGGNGAGATGGASPGASSGAGGSANRAGQSGTGASGGTSATGGSGGAGGTNTTGGAGGTTGGSASGGTTTTGGTANGGATTGGTGATAGMSGSSGTANAGTGGIETSTGGTFGMAGSGAAGTNTGGMSSGGGAGTGAGGATTGSGCDIPGKILCDDFESEAAGSLPMGAPWAPQNCFDTTHVLKVDGGAHHSGAQSLLGENIPYADCQIHADLGASLSEYWVRAWVYWGTAAPTSSTHEVSVFELVPQAGTDDPSIRVGYRGDTCMPVGVELNITGGGQEETGCTGAIPMANTWYCYVLHVQQAASSVTADLSIDGTAQSYTNHGQPQTAITSQVAAIEYLRLGPRSYSGSWSNPIYVDDVAVATQAL
ncbi:MAG TPA: hypothetical protein VMI54_16700, partial [Polyangiaceae bacterium]|nr:hypothetical protein [Polyangiaceae bacterium]